MGVLRKKHHCSSSVVYSSCSKKNLEIKAPRQNSVSKLEPYRETIEVWMLEQMKKSKRKRLSIRALHSHLIALHPDVTFSEKSVSRYIAKLRQILATKNGSFLTLTHEAHECQADFGKFFYYNIDGKEIEGECVALSFPSSGACYMQVFPGKSTESMLTAMQNIFYHIGGVPKDIWLDNDSCFVAVASFKNNRERPLTALFKSFVEHFGFRPVFMNRCAGNEKGAVENALGYLRRNLLVPLPTIVDFDEFNRGLIILSEKQTDRLHYRKTFRIHDRFNEDVKSFLPLPAVKFVCESHYRCKVDNIGCARINKNKAYFVDPKYKGSYVNAVQSYGRCVITADDGTVLYDGKRLYRRELQENIDLASILSVIVKYPNSIAALPIVRSLPRAVQLFIATALPKELEQFVRNMAMIYKMSDMQKTALVAEICATERKFSKKDFLRVYESLS